VIILLRHARAGRRGSVEPDAERPLDDRGRRQAAELAQRLQSFDVQRVLSSPAVRCVQTVEPLAAELGVAVERCDRLAEGTPVDQMRALIEELAGVAAVLCTHGDLTTALLGGHYLRKGHAVVLDPARGLEPVEFLA
jgi:8-oxo-dGTP diphosphatase